LSLHRRITSQPIVVRRCRGRRPTQAAPQSTTASPAFTFRRHTWARQNWPSERGLISGGIGPFISLHLQLDSNGHLTARPSWWSRAVNLRDEAFQFFADAYARKRMFQPALENYWLAGSLHLHDRDLRGEAGALPPIRKTHSRRTVLARNTHTTRYSVLSENRPAAMQWAYLRSRG
jgi:hypothetical protein